MNAPRHLWQQCTTVLSLVALTAVVSCLPPGPSVSPTRPIGTLLSDGPNVFLNGRRAPHGATVFHGDEVSTGEQSSARLELSGGGFVQLAENTDPVWRWLTESGRCLIEFIVRFGQVYGESGACTLRGVSDDATILIHTTFHLSVAPNVTHLAVLEGQAELLAAGSRRVIRSREQAIVRRGRIGVSHMQPARFYSLTRWRDRYDFRVGRPVPPVEPPPARRVIVPDVRRLQLREAQARLLKAGLEPGQMRRVIANVPVGTVLNQSPAPGRRVPRGTAVDLVIADTVR